MPYQIVTNLKIADELRKSRYFKTNLGLVNTVEKNGDRVYNQRDTFSHFYNTTYRTTIYGKGNVGDIMIYVDHYIKEDVLAVYLNTEEFILNYDKNIMKEKGADFYLGHILKTLEEQHEERIRQAELKSQEEKKEANPDIVIMSPGQVSYDDLQAYIKKKKEEKYGSIEGLTE